MEAVLRGTRRHIRQTGEKFDITNSEVPVETSSAQSPNTEEEKQETPSTCSSPTQAPRRSSRTVKPPDRLDL